VKARELLPDGTYRRRPRADGDPVMRSQVALQHLAREAAREGAEPRPPFVPIVRRPRVSGAPAEPTPLAERSRDTAGPEQGMRPLVVRHAIAADREAFAPPHKD